MHDTLLSAAHSAGEQRDAGGSQASCSRNGDGNWIEHNKVHVQSPVTWILGASCQWVIITVSTECGGSLGEGVTLNVLIEQRCVGFYVRFLGLPGILMVRRESPRQDDSGLSMAAVDKQKWSCLSVLAWVTDMFFWGWGTIHASNDWVRKIRSHKWLDNVLKDGRVLF